MKNGTASALVAMCLCTIMWGFNFPIAKIAVREFNPYFIAATRILIATPILFLLVPRNKRACLFSPKVFLKLLPLCLTGILTNQICFITGIVRTTPAHSAILMAAIPIFVALLAMAFLKEKLRIWGWMGVLIGGAGSAGVILSGDGPGGNPTLIGDLITLVGVLAFSIYTVLGRKVVREYGATTVTAGVYLCAALFAPFFLAPSAYSQDWSRISWTGIAALAYMTIFTTVIVYSLYFYALAKLKAAQVAVFSDAQPVLGTTVSIAFGLDIMTPGFMGAGLVALIGILLVQFQPRTSERKI